MRSIARVIVFLKGPFCLAFCSGAWFRLFVIFWGVFWDLFYAVEKGVAVGYVCFFVFLVCFCCGLVCFCVFCSFFRPLFA